MFRNRVITAASLCVVILMVMMVLPSGIRQDAGVSAQVAGPALLPERTGQFADEEEDFTNPPGTNWGTLFGTEYTIGRDIINIDGGYMVAGYGWIPASTGTFDEWGVLAKYDLSGNEIDSASYIDGVYNKAYSVLYDEANDRYMLTGAKYDNYDEGEKHWAHDMVWLASVNGTTLDIDWDRTYPNSFTNWGNSIIADGDGWIIGGFDSISAAAHNGWGWVGRANSIGILNWELGKNADGDSIWLGMDEIYSVIKDPDGNCLLGTEDGIVKFHLDNPPTAASFMWRAAEGAKYYSVKKTLGGGYIGVGEVEVDEAWEGGDSHTDLIITRLDGSGNVFWSKTYGRSAPVGYNKYATGMDDAGYDIVEIGGGHFVVTGYTESYGYHGGKDLLVIEYDSNGDVVWDLALGGEGDDEGRSIVTASNGYVITGTATWNERPRIWTISTPGGFTKPVASFTYTPESPLFIEDPVLFNAVTSNDPDGTIDRYIWDFGDGTIEESTVNTITHRYHSTGTFNATLFVIDNDGIMDEYSQTVITKQMELQWEKSYGTGGNDWIQSFTTTPDGGFMVVGQKRSVGLYCDFWAFKTDLCGNIVWEKNYGVSGYNDVGLCVLAARGGGYIVSAYTAYGSNKIWLMKLDENDGHIIWQKKINFGTNACERIYDIQRDDGGYILTGCGSADVPARFYDLLLLKIDEDGNEVWHKTYPDLDTNKATCGYSVATTEDGGYIVTGGHYYQHGGWGPLYTVKVAGDAGHTEEWHSNYGAPATSGYSGGVLINEVDGGYVAAGSVDKNTALLKYVPDESHADIDWAKTWDISAWSENVFTAAPWYDGGYLIAGDIGYRPDGVTWWDDGYFIRTDAEGNIYWQWKTNTLSPTEGIRDVITFDDGSYAAIGDRYIETTDDGTAWMFKIGPNSVPTAAFTYTPATPGVGSPVHFNASSSWDSEGPVTQFLWDFGDGSTGSGVTIDHAYTATGTYEVTLTAIDADGGADDITKNVTVVPGMGIDFSADTHFGPAPLTIAFESSIIGGTPPFTYAWDFDDDGVTDDTTAYPTWTYDTPGVYSVRLGIRDNNGLVDTLEKLNYIVVTGVTTSDPDVTITTADYTDDPASDPDTYDPSDAPEDIEWATARGFELAAAGPDGTYDFNITFANPLDPGFTLYKLPGWIEIPYVTIDDYTIRISLAITGGVLDPPFVLAGTSGQTWMLDSEIPLAGFYQMEKSGGPGDDGQNDNVEVAAGPGVIWLSDQTAQSPVIFPAGDWRIRIKTLGWSGTCSAQVGEYDGTMFNAFNVIPVDGTLAGDVITIAIPNTGGTVPAIHYLALRLSNTDDGYVITDGDSCLSSPTTDPGFPLDELAAGILLCLGLAGLSVSVYIRKVKKASLKMRS
jgi:PKD repeat protein